MSRSWASSAPLSLFLLLALASPSRARRTEALLPVRVGVSAVTLDTWAQVEVELESLDGRPHRVELRVETPVGLRVEPPATGLEVPAQGRVSARIGLLRAGAPRPSRQEIVVVAVADGPPEARASARGVVEVCPDPARLPRLRPVLLGLAALLLGGAILVEWRRRRRRS